MAKFKIKDALQLRAGKKFDILELDPDSTPGFDGGSKKLDKLSHKFDDELGVLQEKLFANGRAAKKGEAAPSLLVVLQGMDTSGKGGAIRHVFSSFDPQGVDSVGFGAPTKKELEKDFLWRIRKHDPQPGQIVAFDRSHYEDVLIQRVHEWVSEKEVKRRFKAIRAYEKELADNGTVIIKVFLHISKEFQKENLVERVEREDKHWKYDPADLDEREHWDDYMDAYQDAIRKTDEDWAPWYAIPTDNKDYARVALKFIILDALRKMKLKWPEADFDPDSEYERIMSAD